MDLNAYMERNNVSRGELAKRLGITRVHVYYLMTKKRFPSRQLAFKIVSMTGGKVTLEDLFSEKEVIHG